MRYLVHKQLTLQILTFTMLILSSKNSRNPKLHERIGCWIRKCLRKKDPFSVILQNATKETSTENLVYFSLSSKMWDFSKIRFRWKCCRKFGRIETWPKLPLFQNSQFFLQKLSTLFTDLNCKGSETLIIYSYALHCL